MTVALAGAVPTNAPRFLTDVLEDADEALRTQAASVVVWPTGFSLLDVALAGGLHAGELTLLGGAQALGKTTFALQIARNLAAAGRRVLYVCFEHTERDVLQRMLGMELGLQGGRNAPSLGELRHVVSGAGVPGDADGGLVERLARYECGVAALESLAGWGANLRIAATTGRRTELSDVRRLAVDHAADRPVVVVDYLQKVRTPTDVPDEDERVTQVVEGLKDLALELDAPVLAVVAADKAGLGTGRRTRLHHLRGSTALAYEADVALLLNDKFDVVARQHLMFAGGDVERYKEWVVCSVEKNRSGRDDVDIEFQKRFSHGHFDPEGRVVTEKLVDDRIHGE